MPHWDEPDFQQIVCPIFEVGGFAGRQLEGFIDVAHFAWIHTATFADPDNPEVENYTTVETPQGFHADYRSTVGNYPIGVDGRVPTGFEWLRHFEVHLPFTATLSGGGTIGHHERRVAGIGAQNAAVCADRTQLRQASADRRYTCIQSPDLRGRSAYRRISKT
jgi:hypothetical protein